MLIRVFYFPLWNEQIPQYLARKTSVVTNTMVRRLNVIIMDGRLPQIQEIFPLNR